MTAARLFVAWCLGWSMQAGNWHGIAGALLVFGLLEYGRSRICGNEVGLSGVAGSGADPAQPSVGAGSDEHCPRSSHSRRREGNDG